MEQAQTPDNNWLGNFSFSRRTQGEGRWRTEENWREYGIDNGFDKRNPGSFQKSGDKGERSWLTKGHREHWTGDFPFPGRAEEYHFSSEGEWSLYGKDHHYDGQSQRSFARSENPGERSWYNQGRINNWLRDFPFNKRQKN